MKSCRRAVGEAITECGGVFPDAVTPTAEEGRLSPQVSGATYLDAVVGASGCSGFSLASRAITIASYFFFLPQGFYS